MNSLPWVVDFPLLEWDEETERYHAMHHPLLRLPEQLELLEVNLGQSMPMLMT